MVSGRFVELRDLGFGSVQVAGFADVGTVADSSADLFDDTTVTVGPVLRYVTPVGPLSLAYGVPVMLAPGLVSDGRLHLSFGYTM